MTRSKSPLSGSGRGSAGAPAEHVVVVGVDGSEQSTNALAWAAAEARLRGARLRVVHAWTWPASGLGYGGLVTAVVDDEPGLAGKDVDRQIVEVLGPEPDVTIETVVEFGQPAAVLVHASKGADLLVVGSRGHGGFAGLLLGSVSAQVIHHAPCPVTVVPG